LFSTSGLHSALHRFLPRRLLFKAFRPKFCAHFSFRHACCMPCPFTLLPTHESIYV
jgi:hypothetical protein